MNIGKSSTLEERERIFQSFLRFKDKAINKEQGEGFSRNIPEKNVQFFYCNKSFCAFKILRVENVNTCYIYYMYCDKEKDFKTAYYAMINYCLGNNVKFIYYSEKEKDDFYPEFLQNLGYNMDVVKKRYPKDFICARCGRDHNGCICNTNNLYI